MNAILIDLSSDTFHYVDGDAKRLDSIRGKLKSSGLWKIVNDTQETLTWHKSYKFGEL